MAIYDINEYLECELCTNDTFTEEKIIKIKKKYIKSTLTESFFYEKEVIGNKLKCTKCGSSMDNVLNNH